MSKTLRLDRLMTARGAASRRDAKRLVRRGAVTVNGELVRRPETQVSPDAELSVQGIPFPPLPTMVVFHKPLGMVSTMRDDRGRACLDGALPEGWAGHFHPVGRLDADTTGLLLFSRSGAITQWLLHPRRAVERTYRATVEGDLTPNLVDILAEGVETAEGCIKARVENMDGQVVKLTVWEGKHRMVRRMLANAQHPVTALHRLAYGGFTLGELMEGDSRAITSEEFAWLTEKGAPTHSPP